MLIQRIQRIFEVHRSVARHELQANRFSIKRILYTRSAGSESFRTNRLSRISDERRNKHCIVDSSRGKKKTSDKIYVPNIAREYIFLGVRDIERIADLRVCKLLVIRKTRHVYSIWTCLLRCDIGSPSYDISCYVVSRMI